MVREVEGEEKKGEDEEGQERRETERSWENTVPNETPDNLK